MIMFFNLNILHRLLKLCKLISATMEESIGRRGFSASYDLTASQKYYDDDDDWSSVPKSYQRKPVKRVSTIE